MADFYPLSTSAESDYTGGHLSDSIQQTALHNFCHMLSCTPKRPVNTLMCEFSGEHMRNKCNHVL